MAEKPEGCFLKAVFKIDMVLQAAEMSKIINHSKER